MARSPISWVFVIACTIIGSSAAAPQRNVNVLKPFVRLPELKEGSSITLVCSIDPKKVHFDSVVGLLWYKMGRNGLREISESLTKSEYGEVEFSEKLSLTNLKKSDAGMYVCEAETEMGIHQQSIQVSVKPAAKSQTRPSPNLTTKPVPLQRHQLQPESFLLPQPTSVPVSIGSTVDLTCGIDLSRIPRSSVSLIRWTMYNDHGEPIYMENTPNKFAILEADDQYAWRKILRIQNIQPEDVKDYRCNIYVKGEWYGDNIMLTSL